MKKLAPAISALTILLLPAIQAGAGVMIRFKDGTLPPEALAHVEVKALVAEFSGPAGDDVGRSLGALVYAETWNAMSDQRGAGLILLLTDMDESVGQIDKLEEVGAADNYHVLVEKIAAKQQVRAALWGIVSERQDVLVIRSYLTVLGREPGRDLAMRLLEDDSASNPKRRLHPAEGVEVSLLPDRINFDPVIITRDELFSQKLVTNQRAALLDSPSGAATKIGEELPEGTGLRSIGMRGLYFEVRLENGGTGYVDRADVSVEPKRLGESSRRRYSLPAVHFLAGLYRYHGARYREAASQFHLFLETSGDDGYPYNLAIAYQMAAASHMMEGDIYSALGSLEAARSLTPHDPAVHRLFAVAHLGINEPGTAVGHLEEALRLDRRDPQTLRLLESFVALSRIEGSGGLLSSQLRSEHDSILRLEQELPPHSLPPRSAVDE